jgi:hypothetical protein
MGRRAEHVKGERLFAALVAFDDAEGVERPSPGKAPTAFRIWGAGRHETDKGPGVFSQRSAELLMRAQEQRGNLYSIDCDHMSLSQDAPVNARKAVGWHRIGVRLDVQGQPELWAEAVEWTAAVREGLEQDPPEWRYFSPAYEVHPDTREVIGYINMALTNNPATWRVTTLATVAAATKGRTMKVTKNVAAALRAMAASDDEEISKAAQVLCGQIEEEDDAEEKTEATQDTPPADDVKEDVSASVLDLAKRVHELEVERARENESSERERLLASRPDFSADVRRTLRGAPLPMLRDAVANWTRAGGGGTALEAKAAISVQATRGDTQGKSAAGRGLPKEESEALRQRMGLGGGSTPIRHEATASIFRPLTAVEAQRILATKKGNGDNQ